MFNKNFIKHVVLNICPGGVGAIMRACRARDSGSNPGQGAVNISICICSRGPVAQSGRALGF